MCDDGGGGGSGGGVASIAGTSAMDRASMNGGAGISVNGSGGACSAVDSNTLLLSTACPTQPVYRSNLSLTSLSLRASSLTIDSECHATSSV